MMRAFLTKPKAVEEATLASPTGEQPHSASEFESNSALPQNDPDTAVVTDEIFTGYISDVEEDVDEETEGSRQVGGVGDAVGHDTEGLAGDASHTSSRNSQEWEDVYEGPFRVQNPLPLKRQRHDVPIRSVWKRRRLEVEVKLKEALIAIEKLIASKKKTVFEAGRNSLQAYQARAIQSHLHMVLRNGRKHIEASERAAESQGFAAKWGGRLVRQWVRKWVAKRELPVSSRGAHGKVYSLLDDPAVRAELRSYLRSNKWSIDPAKLAEFVKAKSIPTAAEKYIRQVVDEEMPRGLKKYMEMELFPRVQYRKVGKGITLETARQFLHKEGFRFTEHKKALYYDGHERPDVVEYRQDVFLPAMEEYRRRLVEYTVGNVGKELEKKPANYVETRLVLVPHDEMTVQQNDGKKRSWVLNSEHALKKKGVGRGIHVSGVICATKGYIMDAEQTMEYGKNYEGYWTGELFVKQVNLSSSSLSQLMLL